jgi:aspartate aminotransferase-like enzyme
MVMLSQVARTRIDATTSTSFACDLKKWLQIMEAYEAGGFAYHATMPTDSLVSLRNTMREAEGYGFAKLKTAQQTLGNQARALLEAKGYKSVAAPGFQAPCVIVSYTTDTELHNGKKFAAQGLQIAPGVPLQCDEPADFRTFRIGLFGLDKLMNVERTVKTLADALDRI